MVNTLDEEVYMNKSIAEWISGEFLFYRFRYHAFETFTGFAHQCLSTPESHDATSMTSRHDGIRKPDTTLSLTGPAPLLKEWAESKLTSGSWKEALLTTVSVSSIFLAYFSWA